LSAEKVGFIGLGIMGEPMASNLIKKGHELVVHNRSRGPVDKLAAEGAQPAETSREVAELTDVVITMLPDSPQVEEVFEGDSGLLAGASEGTLHIDMSTISPLVTKKLAERASDLGVRTLDAPVSGGQPAAVSGELSIMVGAPTRTSLGPSPSLAPWAPRCTWGGRARARSSRPAIRSSSPSSSRP